MKGTKLGIIFAAAILLCAATAASASAETKQTMRDSVDAWIAELATQPEFAGWKGAEWESAPLGPGTHGFVITVKAQSKEVGYMIVHAAEDGGWTLTEYGLGDQPLFSASRLREALVKQEVIAANEPYAFNRLYCSAFEAVFVVHLRDGRLAVDAKSGEVLPDGTAESANECGAKPLPSTIASTGGANGSRGVLAEPWDAYDNISWMAGEGAVELSEPSLIQRLHAEERLVLKTEPFSQDRIAAYALRGYQQRFGVTYVAVEDFGLRYVPIAQALQAEALYRVSSASS